MANNFADNLSEGVQNIFLAGVGALALSGEKLAEVTDDLIKRGKVTVEEGRKLNEELKHKATVGTEKVREETLRAYIKSLSPEDRATFAQQMADLAKEMNGQDDEVVVEAAEVIDVEDEIVVDPIEVDADDVASADDAPKDADAKPEA